MNCTEVTSLMDSSIKKEVIFIFVEPLRRTLKDIILNLFSLHTLAFNM
jgi:hypothetical protein